MVVDFSASSRQLSSAAIFKRCNRQLVIKYIIICHDSEILHKLITGSPVRLPSSNLTSIYTILRHKASIAFQHFMEKKNKKGFLYKD